MDIQKAIFLVNDAMLEIYHRPSEIYCSDKAAFRDQIVDNLKDPAFRNIVIDSDHEIADQDWLTFLWFVKTGNTVRINDAIFLAEVSKESQITQVCRHDDIGINQPYFFNKAALIFLVGDKFFEFCDIDIGAVGVA